jgi:biotin carboxylase
LLDKLGDAARALGLTHSICMVDFIVTSDEITFLELTPRIGGDCLPPLVRQSCGLDTIGLALDFAEGRMCPIPEKELWTRLVGLRLFSSSTGTLSEIRTEMAAQDLRVREIYLKYARGHKIVLPPVDYNSWMLGHVIFEPDNDLSVMEQCLNLKNKIVISIA